MGSHSKAKKEYARRYAEKPDSSEQTRTDSNSTRSAYFEALMYFAAADIPMPSDEVIQNYTVGSHFDCDRFCADTAPKKNNDKRSAV